MGKAKKIALMAPEIHITDEWSFGNDEEAEKLKALVLTGKKTATTGLFKNNSKTPKTGDYAAILDKNNKRCCIIKYTYIEIKPFLEVEYVFAILEGEGDKNIDDWRQSHRRYFSK